ELLGLEVKRVQLRAHALVALEADRQLRVLVEQERQRARARARAAGDEHVTHRAMLANARPSRTSRAPSFTAPLHGGLGLVTKSASLQANLSSSMSACDRTRVDLHLHSTPSEESRLGVQRAVGLPECATPPQEVYELAKRRGMDFVT